MKKGLFYSILVAGTAAAYYLVKKLELKTNENDDVTFVRIDNKEQYSKDIDEISKLYPNLNKRFIERVYSKNDELNNDYPNGVLVEIKHSLSFSDEEKYNKICEILDSLNYEMNGVMTSFVASKKMYVEKGRVISEIFNIANQVNYSNGMYTGYEIIEQ